MTSEEISYDAYQKRSFPDQRPIRQFGPWQILSSSGNGHFLLLVNAATEIVVVCEYRSAFERQHDIETLKRAADGSRIHGVIESVKQTLLVSQSSAPKPPPPSAAAAGLLPTPGIE